MKRILFFVVSTLLAVPLGACTNNNLNSENTVSEVELTEREKAILSTTAEQSFIFDFNIDDTYKAVSVWVEKYEFGERVTNNKVNQISTQIKDEGTIIFTTSKMFNNTHQSLFNIGVSTKGTNGSTSKLETISEDVSGDYSSMWGSNLAKNTPISGEMVLATIIHSKSGGGMSTLSSDFYKDVDGHIEEIKDYDVVYLLISKFKK